VVLGCVLHLQFLVQQISGDKCHVIITSYGNDSVFPSSIETQCVSRCEFEESSLLGHNAM
jgi:hypothetical protein